MIVRISCPKCKESKGVRAYGDSERFCCLDINCRDEQIYIFTRSEAIIDPINVLESYLATEYERTNGGVNRE